MKRLNVFFLALTLTARLVAADNPADKPAGHGLNLAAIDRSVNPGDDFFAYANGNWVKSTEIPADRSSLSSFAILAEEVDRRNAGLIQQAAKSKAAAGSDARKVGDYYTAYMNEAAIESRGLAPVKPELAAVAAIDGTESLSRLLGSQMRADVDPLNDTNLHTDRLFGIWVSPDFNDPKVNSAYMLQGGLGMPDRDNYLETDETSRALQAKYREHIAEVLKLAGFADTGAKAARIYSLEEKIARAHVSRTESVDVLKANNPWTMSDFATKAPGIDWPRYFEAASLAKQPHIIVWQPSAVTGLSALVAKEPLDTWKDYLAFHVLDRASALLPKAFASENFKFYGTAMTGATEPRARWKNAVGATNGALGEAVGKLYVKKYFPPEAKKAAQEMVKNIVSAFGRRIDHLDWMTPETRAKARAKLGTLYVGIGYPDKWADYSRLEVKRDDAFGNAQRAQMFDYRGALGRLGKPADKTQWWMTPQTVNAVNLPLQNALNFPAAILNPPFFDAKADPVQNYGGIGTVIGHEISHSFDDQGSQFDAAGRLANWWTKEDFAHFSEAADRLVVQYNAYEPLPGQHVNGRLTLSENIADVAGLSAAFDGYRAAYGGQPAPSKQGFSGDQRFFLSFAQVWRSKFRPQALRNSLMTNGHAPGMFRADTVHNIDAWYDAFYIQPGRALYLPPDQRVRVW